MGTISLEHSDRLYWLGRYTERVFTTLKTLQRLLDRMIDKKKCYTDYLCYFGLSDIYDSDIDFINSFFYDKNNPNSVAYSLERAYDNGIVLREEISTEAFSFLQLAKDTLKRSETSGNIRLSLLPLEDQLYAFWGCIADNVYDEEKKNIIYCGKSFERLDLYIRTGYNYKEVKKEFGRLCKRLGNVPENTPYRCNQHYLRDISDIIGSSEKFRTDNKTALIDLGHLFEPMEAAV